MKISSVDVYQVDLPYANGVYRLSGGRTYESFDATIVKVSTDTGIVGWGESTPFGGTYVAAHSKGVRTGLEELAPAVLGMNPAQLDRINDALDQCLVGHPAAKTPIDVACWDILGKATHMPVCDLLGGRVSGAIPLISSIGSDDPDAMRENVARHRTKGFMGHSLKIGSAAEEGGPALDAERIKACLSDKAHGEWFLADANGGLTVEHGLRLLELLPHGMDFVLEAPCASWTETLSLRRRSTVPILLDELVATEADVIQAIRTDACDGVGLKVSKQGGLTRLRRQRDICRSAGLVVSVQDTVGSEIAFAAVLHAAQSTPKQMLRCALDTRSMVAKTTALFDVVITNGGAEAPDIPGLGVGPDINVLGAPVASYKA